MSANQNLIEAKRTKNDEFYTRIEMIEKELLCPEYIQCFAGKTILCDCGDGPDSAFTVFFQSHFHLFGLRKLICTTFGPGAKMYVRDEKGKRRVPLVGNGDFRSEEGRTLIKEADVIVSNPPFSLFREYMILLLECRKGFVIVGNRNAVSYKDIFPLFKDGAVRFGRTSLRSFHTRGDAQSFGNIGWYTNLDTGIVPDPVPLTKTYYGHKEEYPLYDNFPAIEVSKVENIPLDYPGSMGVPLSFLQVHNPEQFCVVGSSGQLARPVYINGKRCTGRFYLNGKRMFDRVVIRRRFS